MRAVVLVSNFRAQTWILVISGIFQSFCSIRTAAQPNGACLCLFIRSNFSKRQLSPAEELRSQKHLRRSVSSPCHCGSPSSRPIGTHGSNIRQKVRGLYSPNTVDLIDYFPPIDASGYHCACLQNVTDVCVRPGRARYSRTCAYSMLNLNQFLSYDHTAHSAF